GKDPQHDRVEPRHEAVHGVPLEAVELDEVQAAREEALVPGQHDAAVSPALHVIQRALDRGETVWVERVSLSAGEMDLREPIVPGNPVGRRPPAGCGRHARRPRQPRRAAARPVSSRVKPSARSSSEVAYESRRNPPDCGPNASPGETTTL